MDFLVIDDDDIFRHRLLTALVGRGFSAQSAGTASQAIALQKESPATKIILDLSIPGVTGLELLRELVQVSPETEIVILTGYGSIPTAIEATRIGAKNFLLKPLDLSSILLAFEKTKASKDCDEVAIPSLEQVEWEHIQRTLAECKGNITLTAQKLGIHRRSLQRKLTRGNPVQCSPHSTERAV